MSAKYDSYINDNEIPEEMNETTSEEGDVQDGSYGKIGILEPPEDNQNKNIKDSGINNRTPTITSTIGLGPAIIDIMAPEHGAISYRTPRSLLYKESQNCYRKDILDGMIYLALNYLELDEAGDRFDKDLKEYQQKKRVEELLMRFEIKYNRYSFVNN
jgi:hypothetical protein